MARYQLHSRRAGRKALRMNEFELKFQVPPERRATLEAALIASGRTRRQRLRARYFDTPSQALARAGAVLRLRLEGRQWVQTAKAAGRSAFDRLEHDVALGTGAEPQVDLERHTGSEVGLRIQQALADSGETQADLTLIFATDIVRLSRTVEAGRASVEIALDTGSIEAAGRRLAVHEIEFERKQGSAAGLMEVVAPWCTAHGLWLDPRSKAEAGFRLAADDPVAAPRQAVKLQPRPGSGAAWLSGALQAGIEQALWNAREIAAGAGEAEHVHQLRVGLRRLRVLLRELASLAVLAPAQEQLPALEALFRELGEHRDQSALLPQQLAVMRAAGAPELALPSVLPDIGAAVRAAPMQMVWLRLLEVLQALKDGERGTASRSALRSLVGQRLARLHRQAFRHGRDFDEADEERRHQVRKQFKRLRYLSELARPLFSGRKVDRYVAQLKAVQDALGHYQDASAGRRHWAIAAVSQPAAWFAAGWLAHCEQAEARACRSACRKAAKSAIPFWE